MTAANPPLAQVKIWVDDDRQPSHGWAWAKTSLEAIQMLQTHDPGVVGELSLDYSLGGGDNGGLVLQWLHNNPTRWPATVDVHTSSVSARALLFQMISDWKPQ